jgi:diguanylate cyclase (GGDEF)-like protein
MDESQKSRIKSRGVLLASAGLGTALLVMLGTSAVGVIAVELETWLLALALTAGVQGLLYLVAARGWDRLIPGDPHFLYAPFLGALILLSVYVFLAPELRLMVLLGWFVALLFMAGLGGFRAVVTLSALMMGTYYAVILLLVRGGYSLSLHFEGAITASVFLISIYAGIVFERLRSDRLEMRALRLQLADMALTDALTQLPNRRRFEEVLRTELDRVRRYGGHCTVGMVDVDFFKHYNDTVGHLAGDVVLRELGDVMRRELRLHDMVARYGGEEFAIIMINAGKDEAKPVLERLLRDVREHPFRHRDIQPLGRITVSAGIASYPEDGTSYNDILRKADEALYAAKRTGRNRLCLAGGTVPAGHSPE